MPFTASRRSIIALVVLGFPLAVLPRIGSAAAVTLQENLGGGWFPVPANLLLANGPGNANPLGIGGGFAGVPFPPGGAAFNTPDGNFSISGTVTARDVAGTFAFLDVTVTATDLTGVTGSLLMDVGETYALAVPFNPIFGLEFMSGSFGADPAVLGTNIRASLAINGALLPIMTATAADADALAFTRGNIGIAPGAGFAVAFDALAQFNFAGIAGGGLAGDSISLPVGEDSAVPEPATCWLISAGLLALVAAGRRKKA